MFDHTGGAFVFTLYLRRIFLLEFRPFLSSRDVYIYGTHWTQTQSNFWLQNSRFRVDDSVNWPLNQSHVRLFDLHFVLAFCSQRKLNFNPQELPYVPSEGLVSQRQMTLSLPDKSQMSKSRLSESHSGTGDRLRDSGQKVFSQRGPRVDRRYWVLYCRQIIATALSQQP